MMFDYAQSAFVWANQNLASKIGKTFVFLRRNELVRTAVLLGFVVLAEYAVFYGLRYSFGTEYLPFHPVSSESMVPTLNVGDLIVVKGIDPKLVTVGEIIVFHSPRNHDMLIVHRVVGVNSQGSKLYFETKGDNNPSRDSWYPYPGVPETNLVGVVIGKIAYIGYIILALKEPLGMTVIVMLTAVVIIYEFIVPAMKQSRKPKSQESSTDQAIKE
jgi:signal peptidase